MNTSDRNVQIALPDAAARIVTVKAFTRTRSTPTSNPIWSGSVASFSNSQGKLVTSIMHPYMAHLVSGNASGRPRFGQFPSLKLSQPMRFSREDPGDYSLSEMVVLEELGN